LCLARNVCRLGDEEPAGRGSLGVVAVLGFVSDFSFSEEVEKKEEEEVLILMG